MSGLHVCVCIMGKHFLFVRCWVNITDQVFYFIPRHVSWRSPRMRERLWRKPVRWSTTTVTSLTPSSWTRSRRTPSLSFCESRRNWTSSRTGSLPPGSAKTTRFYREIWCIFSIQGQKCSNGCLGSLYSKWPTILLFFFFFAVCLIMHCMQSFLCTRVCMQNLR